MLRRARASTAASSEAHEEARALNSTFAARDRARKGLSEIRTNLHLAIDRHLLQRIVRPRRTTHRTDSVLHLNDRARRRRNPRPEIGALLRNRTRDGAPLQLALRVANHPRVVFKVNDQALLASDRLALADNDGRENLLTQIRLTLLHSRHDHATRVRSRQTVLTATPACE